MGPTLDYIGRGQFAEFKNSPNVTMGKNKVLTYEPCNYASNVAFYHSVVKLCDYDEWTVSEDMQRNLMRSVATLGFGSSFLHQSYTYLGDIYDNRMIAIIAFLAYQMTTEAMQTNSSIVHELHF